MPKKLILLLLALVTAVAATSAIMPVSATSCPPPQIQAHCDGFTICCYKFQPCICPS